MKTDSVRSSRPLKLAAHETPLPTLSFFFALRYRSHPCYPCHLPSKSLSRPESSGMGVQGRRLFLRILRFFAAKTGFAAVLGVEARRGSGN